LTKNIRNNLGKVANYEVLMEQFKGKMVKIMDQDLLHNISFDERSQRIFDEIWANRPEEKQFIGQMLQKDYSLDKVLPNMLLAFEMLVKGFEAGHTLFLCGNGGSIADCMHIAGELMKSFYLRRHLSASNKADFSGMTFGDVLAEHLEYGLPCIVLGFNHSLSSAILNDSGITAIQYAQELYVLGKKGDLLLGISTSGNALNVLHAVSTAKVRGMATIGLTGHHGGQLAQMVDLAIKAPETVTPSIQEQHEAIYHTLCAMLESRFFSRIGDSLWKQPITN
jgi:D-sedoheptulose 7-phosphate isomerase